MQTYPLSNAAQFHGLLLAFQLGAKMAVRFPDTTGSGTLTSNVDYPLMHHESTQFPVFCDDNGDEMVLREEPPAELGVLIAVADESVVVFEECIQEEAWEVDPAVVEQIREHHNALHRLCVDNNVPMCAMVVTKANEGGYGAMRCRSLPRNRLATKVAEMTADWEAGS